MAFIMKNIRPPYVLKGKEMQGAEEGKQAKAHHDEECINRPISSYTNFKHKKYLVSKFEKAMMIEANSSELVHKKPEKVNIAMQCKPVATAAAQPPVPANPPPPDTPPPTRVHVKKEIENNEYKTRGIPVRSSGLEHSYRLNAAIKTDCSEEKSKFMMCRNFARGACHKESTCKFAHKLILSQLPGIYTFCRNFQNTVCSYRNCKFVHATVFEKEHFFRTGYLPPHAIAHLKEASVVQQPQLPPQSPLPPQMQEASARLPRRYSNTEPQSPLPPQFSLPPQLQEASARPPRRYSNTEPQPPLPPQFSLPPPMEEASVRLPRRYSNTEAQPPLPPQSPLPPQMQEASTRLPRRYSNTEPQSPRTPQLQEASARLSRRYSNTEPQPPLPPQFSLPPQLQEPSARLSRRYSNTEPQPPLPPQFSLPPQMQEASASLPRRYSNTEPQSPRTPQLQEASARLPRRYSNTEAQSPLPPQLQEASARLPRRYSNTEPHSPLPPQLQEASARLPRRYSNTEAQSPLPPQLQEASARLPRRYSNTEPQPPLPPQMQEASARLPRRYSNTEPQPPLPPQLQEASARLPRRYSNTKPRSPLPPQLQETSERYSRRYSNPSPPMPCLSLVPYNSEEAFEQRHQNMYDTLQSPGSTPPRRKWREIEASSSTRVHDSGEPLAKKCKNCDNTEFREQLMKAKVEKVIRANKELGLKIKTIQKKNAMRIALFRAFFKQATEPVSETGCQYSAEQEIYTMLRNNSNWRSTLTNILRQMGALETS